MIARNERGDILVIRGRHPRKELLEILHRKHADRIYIDRKDGETIHVGYYIARHWWTLYEMWKRPAFPHPSL